MKWRELVEGQNDESSVVCMALLQANNNEYQKLLKYIMDRADEEVPQEILDTLR